MARLRLGDRKRGLAQAQARWVAERLQVAHPSLSVELVPIVTTGDQPGSAAKVQTPETPTHGLQAKHSSRGGLKTLFTKEIEDALLANEVDLAVHSMKDMAAEIPPGLVLAAVPQREDPRAVWLSRLALPIHDPRPGVGHEPH